MRRMLLTCVLFSAVVLLPAPAIDAAATNRQGPFAGEFRIEERGPHLTEELRAEIRGKIDRNIALLKEQGLLQEAAIDEPGPLLSRPLRGADALRDFDFGDTMYFVTYYRDQRNTDTTVYTIYRPQQIGGSCPKCGNGVIEHVELCDADNLNGESCLD